jgi:Arf-GAP/SH3 domain/ANK repeat/PH domain-containing protein
MKAFDNSGKTGSDKVNHSLIELQQAIIRYIQKIPGNDRCCDCNSQNGNDKLQVAQLIRY